VFHEVVVAVDGTRAGNEAGRQAAMLVAPGGRVRLVGVADPYSESTNDWGGEPVLSADDAARDDGPVRMRTALRDAVGLSLDALRLQLPAGLRVEGDVIEGRVRDVLQEIAADADLIALGDHGRRRIVGIIAASTVTEMLHRSECSVLISRPCFDPARFPTRIAVAVDGSAPSLQALDVGVAIAGAGSDTTRIEAVVAGRSAESVATVVRERGTVPAYALPGRAVPALIDVGDRVDLIVLGAQGHSGAKAVGSVAERVAHRTSASVLVVRPA
jgi:nucleotide-binding universal stress UspA family protein